MISIRSLMSKLLWGNHESSRLLMVPSYDEGTEATAKWVTQLNIGNIAVFVGDQATHSALIGFVRQSKSNPKLILFVGHGNTGGLFTRPGLGKTTSLTPSVGHEYLIDAEDLDHFGRAIHIFAWACQSGNYFGAKVSSLRASGFLGFNGAVNMVINDESSESLWKSAIVQSLARIGERGHIESHDAEWMRHLLLKLRDQIKNGEIDTGLYNRLNRMFLKSAAKHATVYLSKEE